MRFIMYKVSRAQEFYHRPTSLTMETRAKSAKGWMKRGGDADPKEEKKGQAGIGLKKAFKRIYAHDRWQTDRKTRQKDV